MSQSIPNPLREKVIRRDSVSLLLLFDNGSKYGGCHDLRSYSARIERGINNPEQSLSSLFSVQSLQVQHYEIGR